MSTNLKILFAIIFLFIVQCSDDENPINASSSGNEYGKLSINTDKDVYSWQQGESKDYIIIQGQLENKSDSIFYSRLGDWYNSQSEQKELLIAGNSAGYIEKYNESDNLWYEINILALLIEGSKFVPIKPLLIYSIYGHLIKDNDTEEKGKYRLRIDYYEYEHPDSALSPFQDYSNTFEIK